MKLKRITVICGHYGSGKTNFSINLAVSSAAAGKSTVLIDMDVVNPYFRSSGYATELNNRGVEVISPLYAGSNLDIPALSPRIEAALSGEYDSIIIDAGGDDVGATALGRFAGSITRAGYDMLYVVNMYRKMSDTPQKAAGLLYEIQTASRLYATGIVNNSHLGEYTDAQTVLSSDAYANEVSVLTALPLVYTAVKRDVLGECGDKLKNPLEVDIYVSPPWPGN